MPYILHVYVISGLYQVLIGFFEPNKDTWSQWRTQDILSSVSVNVIRKERTKGEKVAPKT